jgi:hypothetical protein
MSRENVATTRGSITPLVIEAFSAVGSRKPRARAGDRRPQRPVAQPPPRAAVLFPCSLRPRGLGSGNQDPAEGRSDGKARVE